jgi:hypothetical protein
MFKCVLTIFVVLTLVTGCNEETESDSGTCCCNDGSEFKQSCDKADCEDRLECSCFPPAHCANAFSDNEGAKSGEPDSNKLLSLDDISEEVMYELRSTFYRSRKLFVFAATTITELPPIDCESACSDPTSPFCLSIKSSAGPIHGALMKASQLFSSTDNSHLEKAKIMEIFEEAEDPCDRSDVIFENRNEKRLLINTGHQCFLSKNLKFVGNLELNAVITIPEKLVAEVVSDGDGVSYSFMPPYPTIGFDKLGWTKDYGGEVRTVTIGDYSHYISTSAGTCFSIN